MLLTYNLLSSQPRAKFGPPRSFGCKKNLVCNFMAEGGKFWQQVSAKYCYLQLKQQWNFKLPFLATPTPLTRFEAVGYHGKHWYL